MQNRQAVTPFDNIESSHEYVSLLAKAVEANVVPKIFYSHGSYEYWGRAASLIHTSP